MEFKKSIDAKKKTLRAYEAALRYPGIVDPITQEIGKRCEVCAKVFAGTDYLLAHYKRRHT